MVVPTMDTLPRVPDTHGDTVDEKLFSDLYIRTSWVDAHVALDQIDKGKARGNRTAVYMRSVFQSHLQSLGYSLQKHAGKVLFVAILVLSTFCVGLKSAQMHSKVHQLWIQEGGRLEKELIYTQKSIGEVESSTHQLIIQTAHDPNASVLHPQALLTHLEVLKKATSVTIHMFDTTWSLRDMCNIPTIPSFEEHFIEQIFDHIIPCSIITPLDCFWEGSKLLGPEFPVHIPGMDRRVQWTSLNPQDILQSMKNKIKDQFPFDTVEQYMKRAAISSGYTKKPCLNPDDPQCPDTSPNKNSKQTLDIGAILSGGCYGYAAKYMHWPEELIVGGVIRNRTGHLKKAKGLQTVVQLMTEKEMYDSWNDQYKVHHIGWTQDKAAEVLNAWQKKFSNEVNNLLKTSKIGNSYDIYVFSSASLDDILEKFSNANPLSIATGIGVIILYTFLTLIRWKDPVKGQSSVGIAGVILIGMSTAAGLGLCALLGIVFNAATTQVVPFLALGLGVDNIFMLTSAYSDSDRNEETKNILKKVGPSVLFSAVTTAGSFFAAVFIPVPALKVFCLQAAIVMCFNLAAALLVFPAMITLDLRRRAAGRADIFCCCFPIWKEKQRSMLNNNNNNNSIDSGRHNQQNSIFLQQNRQYQQYQSQQQQSQQQQQQQEALLSSSCTSSEKKLFIDFKLSKFAYKYYMPFLLKGSTKFFTILLFCGIIIFSLLSSLKLQDGLDLIDLVPKNTNEYNFLKSQTTMFGFYNMFAVTQGNFEYPQNQKLLHEYHETFVRIPHVLKNDNGGLPDFWLSLFRDWLINLQITFDKELKDGKITRERWYSNASSDAILAYKLLVQTGYVDNPIDKSLVTQNRLVDSDGIINPKAFYNYLSAWATNDVFAYGASQGKLRPEPRQWYHQPSEYELKIPKSLPLVYTQLPFYLHGLTDTAEIKNLISHIRVLSEKFEARGLPNYPSGIPFMFWEQYMTLRTSLALILCSSLIVAFILVSILLLSIWAAFLVIINVIISLIQIFGAMTLLGIKLSAIPAVILILSVGLVVSITVHVALGFITSVGNRERRICLSMQISLAPLIHGILTSVLAVIMLSSSPFEFIVRHFFWLLLTVLIIGGTNGLIFFPIILSMIGPDAELIPLEYPDRISTPSPIIQRSKRGNSSSSNYGANKTVIVNGRSSSSRCNKPHYHHKHVNINNEPSLTTITEEPPSWKSSSSSITGGNMNDKSQNTGGSGSTIGSSNGSSTKYHHQQQQQHQQYSQSPQSSSSSSSSPNKIDSNNYPELQSIVVQPEVTVETHHNGSDNINTTKVTATANIKVELVAPGRATRNFNFSS